MITLKEIATPRFKIRQRSYKSQRMSLERSKVLEWMQEYERANTKPHRDVCKKMIDMHLKRHEYYGNR